jgi:hypothetical protein
MTKVYSLGGKRFHYFEPQSYSVFRHWDGIFCGLRSEGPVHEVSQKVKTFTQYVTPCPL